MNKIIVVLILCLSFLCCQKGSQAFDFNVKIDLENSKVTKILDGYTTAIYIIEYKNYLFAINTKGGIILLKDSTKDKE